MAVFLPSRGRPEKCEACIRSILDTIGSSSTRIYVLLDEGDPRLPEYMADAAFHRNEVVYLVGPDGYCGDKLNWAFKMAPYHDSYFLCGDDIRCESKCWDIEMKRAMKQYLGGFGMVFGDDGKRGPDYANHPLISGDILRALGYFAHPKLKHGYLDTVLWDVCRAIGRTHYLPDIKHPHFHHVYGKSELDETYAKADAVLKECEDAYKKWVRDEKDSDVEKVRKAMNKCGLQ